MTRRRAVRLVAVPVVAVGVVAVLALGRDDAAEPVAEPVASPTATAAPAPTPTPTPAATPTPSAEPAATAGPAPTATPSPTAPTTAPTTDPEPEPEPTTEPAPGGGATVDVAVTVHGWDAERGVAEVVAFAGAVQDGGTCTLTLEGPGGVVTGAPSPAVPDVSTTACGSLAVERARLAPGPWQATVTYRSATSTGTSAPVTIEVP